MAILIIIWLLVVFAGGVAVGNEYAQRRYVRETTARLDRLDEIVKANNL